MQALTGPRNVHFRKEGIQRHEQVQVQPARSISQHLSAAPIHKAEWIYDIGSVSPLLKRWLTRLVEPGRGLK
jgi:hypothetical protein